MISLQQLLSTIAPVNLSLKSKPISFYTESLNKSIEAILSQLNVITIHKEKFNQIAKYLQKIKQLIFSNQTMHISLPFAKHIEIFKADLAKIHDFSLKCTDYNIQKALNDQSFLAIWALFLHFWLSSFKFLTFIDPNQFLDLIPLCNAHMNDLANIKSSFSSRISPDKLKELNQILATSPESINFKLIKCQEFLSKTPFSFNFKVSVDNTINNLEIFNPEFNAGRISQKYFTMLSQLVHPNIIPFNKSSNSLPYSILTPFYPKGTLSSHMHIPMTDSEGNAYTSSDLSPTRLSIILLDTARALEYLHSRKICHRNLNPGNIYLNNNYSAILSGMLNICNEKIVESQIPFSPYTAPEVLLDPSYYDEKSDVYSFTYLVWELYHNEIPFGKVSPETARNEIMYQDLRPHLPSDPSIVNFFICGWLRNPKNRPSMSEIVASIENKEILIPGTDEAQFSSYVESTRRKHNAALKGILELQISTLKQLESANYLDDKAIELLLNVCIDSQDSQMRETSKRILLKNLERAQNLSLQSLVEYCHLSLIVPSIQPRVLSMCNQLPDRNAFLNQLFSSMEKSLSIKFLILLGLREVDCPLILEAGCSQPPDISEKAANAVISSFPHSSYIFDYAKRNPVYYAIALQYIKSLDDETLNRMSKRILLFADGATDEVLNDLNALVMRIDIAKNAEFDPNCLLFKLLAEGGHIATISKFAKSIVYCTRFVQKLLPDLVEKCPDVALKIATAASAFKELERNLHRVNIAKLIATCVALKKYDVAFVAAGKIAFPRRKLEENFDQAEEIAKHLCTVASKDENTQSLVLFALLPFALYADWNGGSQKVGDVAAKLIQTGSETVAQRALTFTAAFSQNREVSKSIANSPSPFLKAADKFIDGNQQNFAYLAIRIIANLAPNLQATADVENVVRKEVDIVKNSSNVRIATAVVQSFLLFQKNEWTTMCAKCGVSDAIACIVSSSCYSSNSTLMALVNKLKAYSS